MARISACGAVIACVFTVLTGCATVPERNDVVVLDQIHSSAARIERQLTALSAARAPQVTAYPQPTSGPLADPITLSWSGPMEPAVQSVADLIGFRVRHTGRPPTLPILVRVRVHNTAAFSVLQTLGWQAGTRAGLVVVPARRVIDIVYVARVHHRAHRP